jgi:hypothetical protein
MTIVAAGKSQIAVNTGTLAQGDTIGAYLVSASSALVTSTNFNSKDWLDTRPINAYAEDSAHSSGDYGSFIMGVRSDTGGPFGADGDYVPFSMDSQNRLRVAAEFNADFDFVYDEDTAHTDGDPGAFTLSVRKDSPGSTAGTSGDYAAYLTNEQGELRTVDKAETAILQQVVTVGTTALALPTTALTSRKSVMIQMLSGGQLYIGSATVTNSGSTRGIKLGEGGFITLDVGPSVDVYGIANAAGKEVAVLEMA